MNRLLNITESYKLTPIETLQDTRFKQVNLMQSDDGQAVVLKFCKQVCPSLKLETIVLKEAARHKYKYLEFPRHISNSDDYLLMSFVTREYQTRDSILDRHWTDQDLSTVYNGFEEFKTLRVPAAAYSFKQHIMGFVYPSLKMLLILPQLIKRRVLGPNDLVKSIVMALVYLVLRLGFKNVTTHYDMTTLNCALTPNNSLSILDLEFGYARGDSFFDLCYILTIPPQAIQDWGYQNRLMARTFQAQKGRGKDHRIRFILLLCCLVRLLHFEDNTVEQNAYRQSVDLLLNGSNYKVWTKGLKELNHDNN